MTRPQIYLTKDKKIRVGEKSPDGYVPADLAQSLADALERQLRFLPMEGESSIDAFERVAVWFRAETGYIRPGKDCVLNDLEERRAHWETWVRDINDQARAALANYRKGE